MNNDSKGGNTKGQADNELLHTELTGDASSSHPLVDMDEDMPQLIIDDLPPLYSEIAADGGPVAEGHVPGVGVGSAAHDPLLWEGEGMDDIGIIDFMVQSRERDSKNKSKTEVIIPQLDHDQDLLYRYLVHWAETPPRPFVQLTGTHTHTVDRNDHNYRNNRGDQKESETVTDFDIRIELTPYLFSDAQRRQGLRSFWTPGMYEKVRRGTVFRCQDPEVTGNRAASELPLADGHHDARYWCLRYTEDPAPLKSFQLRRSVKGFNEDKVRTQLEQLVRRTNYRGRLSIRFPVDGAELTIYNNNRLNRWRLLFWLQLLCTLTLMIVFTWPYLFFRTKRYETFGVSWHFSQHTGPDGTVRYTSLSEDQWCNLWGRAVTKAVLGRRKGLLDQNDLREAEGAEQTFQSGNEAFHGAVDLVQASINAMGHVNRQFGWGDDC